MNSDTNRPTPIMDAFTLSMNGSDDATHLVALDLFARQLERERDEWKSRFEKLMEASAETIQFERALANRLANALLPFVFVGYEQSSDEPENALTAWKEARK